MQTNNLVEPPISQQGSKENPIFIKSKEELLEVKTDSYVKYLCKVCGNEVIKQKPHSKSRIEKFAMFLCYSCFLQDTCIKKYGVKHFMELDKIKEKQKQTNLDKYGVEFATQSELVKSKIRESNIKKYGVCSYSKTDDFVRKVRKTCNEKYGADNYFKTDDFKSLMETIHNSQSYKDKKLERLEKMKQTNQQKFGVDFPMQLEERQENRKKTNIQKYGVAFPQSLETFKEKQRNTCLRKYGTPYYRPHKAYYCFESLCFDSSWELAFYAYHKSIGSNIIREPLKIPFHFNNEIHYYYPDFKIDEKLYEIKGQHFFKSDGTLYNPYNRKMDGLMLEKQKLMTMYNVTIVSKNEIGVYLDFMKKTYGKGWKKQFRVK